MTIVQKELVLKLVRENGDYYVGGVLQTPKKLKKTAGAATLRRKIPRRRDSSPTLRTREIPNTQSAILLSMTMERKELRWRVFKEEDPEPKAS